MAGQEEAQLKKMQEILSQATALKGREKLCEESIMAMEAKAKTDDEQT